MVIIYILLGSLVLQFHGNIVCVPNRYTTLEQDKITNDARWELDTKILRQAHEKALQVKYVYMLSKLHLEDMAHIVTTFF
jgi:hypothetical protein